MVAKFKKRKLLRIITKEGGIFVSPQGKHFPLSKREVWGLRAFFALQVRYNYGVGYRMGYRAAKWWKRRKKKIGI